MLLREKSRIVHYSRKPRSPSIPELEMCLLAPFGYALFADGHMRKTCLTNARYVMRPETKLTPLLKRAKRANQDYWLSLQFWGKRLLHRREEEINM